MCVIFGRRSDAEPVKLDHKRAAGGSMQLSRWPYPSLLASNCEDKLSPAQSMMYVLMRVFRRVLLPTGPHKINVYYYYYYYYQLC